MPLPGLFLSDSGQKMNLVAVVVEVLGETVQPVLYGAVDDDEAVYFLLIILRHHLSGTLGQNTARRRTGKVVGAVWLATTNLVNVALDKVVYSAIE